MTVSSFQASLAFVMKNKGHEDASHFVSTTPGDTKARITANGTVLPSVSDADSACLGEATPLTKLSAEEQMALDEKDLKENDWGHQPCGTEKVKWSRTKAAERMRSLKHKEQKEQR